MNAAPVAFVVDASVGVKLFVAEPLSAAADALFALLTADPPGRLVVPDLFYVECANILWKHVRRFGYSADDARQNLADLTALSVIAVPIVDLVAEALPIALDNGISAYDACYVALARRLQLPLVTADERLVRVFARSTDRVEGLGTFNLPSP